MGRVKRGLKAQFCSEDVGSTFVENVHSRLPDCTVLRPGRIKIAFVIEHNKKENLVLLRRHGAVCASHA